MTRQKVEGPSEHSGSQLRTDMEKQSKPASRKKQVQRQQCTGKMKVGSLSLHRGNNIGFNLTRATVMEVDNGVVAAASSAAPVAKGASRIQKRGRGKASLAMVFPVYKKGKRTGGGAGKKQRG